MFFWFSVYRSEILRVIDSVQLTDLYKVATPADWEVSWNIHICSLHCNVFHTTTKFCVLSSQTGESCMVLPTIKNDDIPKLFPKGVKTTEVPSGKQYIRVTPYPAPHPCSAGNTPWDDNMMMTHLLFTFSNVYATNNILDLKKKNKEKQKNILFQRNCVKSQYSASWLKLAYKLGKKEQIKNTHFRSVWKIQKNEKTFLVFIQIYTVCVENLLYPWINLYIILFINKICVVVCSTNTSIYKIT